MRVVTAAAVAGVFLVGVVLASGGSLEELAAELHDLQEKWERERSGLLARVAREEAAVERLRRQKDELRKELTAVEAEAGRLSGRVAERRKEVAALTAKRDALVKVIGESAGRLRRAVRKGVPYRLEEREAAVPTPGDDLEASIEALFEAHLRELALGGQWEGYRDFLKAPDGRLLRGYIIRCGLVTLWFVGDAGDCALLGRVDGEWRWSFSRDVALYHALSGLLRQVLRRSVPQMVDAPLSRSLLEEWGE